MFAPYEKLFLLDLSVFTQQQRKDASQSSFCQKDF